MPSPASDRASQTRSPRAASTLPSAPTRPRCVARLACSRRMAGARPWTPVLTGMCAARRVWLWSFAPWRARQVSRSTRGAWWRLQSTRTADPAHSPPYVSGPSQQLAIRSTLGVAGTDPSALDGLEMHGSGTSLGDPIEVGALHAVLVAPSRASRLAPLTLSAVNSYMGHTEPAAGAVGLLHAVIGAPALSARPIAHLTASNPHLISLTCKAVTGAVDSTALPR